MVSTLREAEVFADAGVTDMTYGVGIAPQKLAQVQALRARGVDLAVILDSVEQAEAVAAASTPELPLAGADRDRLRRPPLRREARRRRPCSPASPRRSTPRAELRGVLTHGGESYAARGRAALEAAAEGERLAVVAAAESCAPPATPAPSSALGSTPTLMSAASFDGADRVPRRRLRLLRPVPGRRRRLRHRRDRALGPRDRHRPPAARRAGPSPTPAGWRCRATAAPPTQARRPGLRRRLRASTARRSRDLIVVGANQEHGIVAPRPGSAARPPDLPVGARLRVLPNHACATAAQYDRYHVLRDGAVAANGRVSAAGRAAAPAFGNGKNPVNFSELYPLISDT